jgi:hypothetical protein
MSDALTLCSILLLDYLKQSKYISVNSESLQDNKDLLQHAWLGGNREWLIVSCEPTVQQSDISDTCNKISENTTDNPTKRAIILTAYSDQHIPGFLYCRTQIQV